MRFGRTDLTDAEHNVYKTIINELCKKLIEIAENKDTRAIEFANKTKNNVNSLIGTLGTYYITKEMYDTVIKSINDSIEFISDYNPYKRPRFNS